MAKADKIGVSGLELAASIGITEQERASPQPLSVDFFIYKPLAKAAKSDDIADTVNYSSVCKNVEDLCKARPYNLIESFAESVASMILSSYETDGVEVTVRKPYAIKKAECALVFIQRGVK